MNEAQIFELSLGFFWLPGEDGQPYHVTPRDPGGATNYGVTFSTWEAWCDTNGRATSLAEFKAMQKTSFTELLHTNYFNACQCGRLGPVGIEVFDMAANAGPGRAARLLQRVVGTVQDGRIGPKTIAAVAAFDPVDLVNQYAAVRRSFYQSLPGVTDFPGWLTRSDACRDYVLNNIAAPDADPAVATS